MKGKSSYPPLTMGAALRSIWVVGLALSLADCNHGSSSSSTTGSYTIGGTISGLTAGTLVLFNGSTTVGVTAGATTWVFASSFSAGSSYAVSVLTNPTGELCEVANGGSGTALTGNVDNVSVTCSPYGQWTWEAGLNAVNATGVYGTQGAAAASNLPSARYDSSSWTDAAGNLWLFGGYGYDSTGALGPLNDLWRYSPSTGQWTWIGGVDVANATGVYGTQGTAAASNVPGARYSASTWIDASGNLWLFGGYGYGATGVLGSLNDLWRYSPSSEQWTWVGGGNGDNTGGVYGTQGAGAAGDVPGARYSANSWIDTSGNLWLFGGYGYDSTGAVGYLNDLWRYSLSNGVWTWVGGGMGDNSSGVYGTQATPSASNRPGARQAANSWIDSSGNVWLFGGYGYDSTGAVGYLNDLWQYSLSTGWWTWVTGGNGDNASGVYGTQGAAAAGNTPGARQAASTAIDITGNLWLFGGGGYDSNGAEGYLNDLWQFSLSSGQWTWVNGSNVRNATGTYATQGSASGSNIPGARQAPSSWSDASGSLWMYGGVGYDSTANGYLNDLWQFVPP
ncbi:MAG: kelch repeat-containing protein [Steroidobacteraceae bacterium]